MVHTTCSWNDQTATSVCLSVGLIDRRGIYQESTGSNIALDIHIDSEIVMPLGLNLQVANSSLL
jgi:hypothetical protein